MTKKLKILFTPLDAIGHMNSALGMAEVLKESGHRVMFAINDQWRGKLSKYGIEELVLSQEDRPADEDPAKRWAYVFNTCGKLKNLTPLEVAIMLRQVFPYMADEIKQKEPKLEQLLKDIAPDVIIVDHVLTIPSIELSGIPWVLVSSNNPLFLLDDELLPPGLSGIAEIGMSNESKLFRTKLREASLQIWQNWNNYIVLRGLQPLPELEFIRHSKWLNIYNLPIEMDYKPIASLFPKWYRFDTFKRTDKHLEFKIPDQLSGKPGKLIYFSMGSMGGADIPMMKRLVAILSKSPHRFIVSKGPYGEEYELSDNMWGLNVVPQIQVLPIVDLVITHGGNNTVTESLYFGKSMIVMPIFTDQLNNAQRVFEKGLGIRLSPYDCTEDQLLNGIESLLNDKQLNEKMKTISKRIQTDNSIAKLPQLIESLVK